MAWPVIGSLARISVAFGGAVLLVNITDMGVRGVFAAIGAGMAIYGALIALAVYRTRWR